jgi:pSer/pThr/pTyr-binding forkhead associated (FHA) protein
MPNLLRVRLSLKGRPLKTFTFDQKDVRIGRDPECEICLDNAGISRHHARIERTPGGYMVEDLGSANGTFLNDQPVKREFVGHDDVVQIGKFALWIGVETDRRGDESGAHKSLTPAVYEGTVVLDPDTLMDLQRKSKEPVTLSTPLRAAAPAATGCPKGLVAGVGIAAFALGAAAGALAMRYFGG